MAAELNASLLSLHPGCQAIIRYHKTGHEQQITGVVTKLDATFPSGKPFNAAKGMNCLARSETGIFCLKLFPTFMSSNLSIPFPGSRSFL